MTTRIELIGGKCYLSSEDMAETLVIPLGELPAVIATLQGYLQPTQCVYTMTAEQNEWWWQRTNHLSPEQSPIVRELLRTLIAPSKP